MIVCEDFEGESEEDEIDRAMGQGAESCSDISSSIIDTKEKNKRDRIK